MTRLRDKGFLLSTLLTLVILAVVAALPGLIGDDGPRRYRVGLAGPQAAAIGERLDELDAASADVEITLVPVADRDEAEARVRAGDLRVALVDDGTLIVDDEVPERLAPFVEQAARVQGVIEAAGPAPPPRWRPPPTRPPSSPSSPSTRPTRTRRPTGPGHHRGLHPVRPDHRVRVLGGVGRGRGEDVARGRGAAGQGAAVDAARRQGARHRRHRAGPAGRHPRRRAGVGRRLRQHRHAPGLAGSATLGARLVRPRVRVLRRRLRRLGRCRSRPEELQNSSARCRSC